VLRRIEVVARAVDAEDRARSLADEVVTGFARLTARRRALTRSPRALFLLSLQNGRPLVGGRGTTADAMLALAGAVNAAADVSGWKPLSDEGVLAAAPEAIVTIEHGPGGAAPDPFAIPAFAGTPAGKRRNLLIFDALYLLGFGPRTPAAAMDLMAALHPGSAEAAPRAAP
jgi:iron complex transport system substrate-binding protein